MNKFMYRTSTHLPAEIQKFEVTEVTDKTVTYKEIWWRKEVESRQLKETSRTKWHETWEEARDYLLKRAESKIYAAKKEIEHQRNIIGTLCEMKEDE